VQTPQNAPTKHIYIALDSDILRSLAILAPYYTNNVYFDYKTSKDFILSKYTGYLLRLLDRVVNQKDIRLLVTASTFYEVRNHANALKFINEFCYVPQLDNFLNFESVPKKELIKQLAYAYCGIGKSHDSTSIPPMEARYFSEVSAYCPTNDCYIMAEATVENACLLTNNAKDFIFNSNFPQDDASRAIGIIEINRAFGYVDEDDIVPRPFAISMLGPLLKLPIEQMKLSKSSDLTKLNPREIE